MRKKMIVLVVFSSFTFLLAGCNQSLEDLIKIGEDILASLTGDAESEQTGTDNEDDVAMADDDGFDNNQAGETTNEEAEESEDAAQLGESVAFKGGPYTPFHVQLQEDGYNLYSLPNGFPFELPYHWVFVGGEFGTSKTYFEGNFCFYLPYEQDDLVDVFADYTGADVARNGAEGNYFETTSYTLTNEVYNTSGTIHYYVDENDHTCAYLTVDDSDAEIFLGIYGEDPNTMVGPDDDDYNGPIEWEGKVELENFHFVDDGRQRSLPNNYDDIVASLATSELNKDDGAKSIREAIKTGEIAIQHIEERFMRILPYEWFFLDYEEVPQSDVWSAEFCTDLTVEQSIAAQLDMLENYNANIFEITLSDGTTPGLAEIQFEFNDPYYTGSWNGRTWFNHTDNSGETSGYRCMHVDMHFSSDRLE